MKRTIIISVTILACLGVTAQDFNPCEFSINTGGGVSGFQTRTAEGSTQRGPAITCGTGYHVFFNPFWGIGTGVNLAFYSDGIAIDDYSKQQTAINELTFNAFDFRVVMTGYREKHQAVMATIPLMLQYQSAGNTAFYVAAGGKAGIPLSTKSKPEGSFTTTGYFPNVNVTYENLPEYGFVNSQPVSVDKSGIKLKTAMAASAETGVKWRLSKTVSLYTGVYADLGLNNILKRPAQSENANLVVYQTYTPSKFYYNNAVNSYAKQMKPFTAGITVRVAAGRP